MSRSISMPNHSSEMVLYTTADGEIRIDTVFQNETLWLTQGNMAELFGVHVPAISKHLGNIFEEGELQKDSTVSKMETVQMEGAREVSRKKEFYNLDAIIAVGRFYEVGGTTSLFGKNGFTFDSQKGNMFFLSPNR